MISDSRDQQQQTPAAVAPTHSSQPASQPVVSKWLPGRSVQSSSALIDSFLVKIGFMQNPCGGCRHSLYVPYSVSPYPLLRIIISLTPYHHIPYTVSPYPVHRIIIFHTPYHHIPYSVSSYTILRIIISRTPYHHIPYSVSSYTILIRRVVKSTRSSLLY